ncbi:MAG: inorganic diphosphatase [Nitrososphaerota archaeon]|nr:inorganic diphosphatase [Nitrososphaerota archaeon]
MSVIRSRPVGVILTEDEKGLNPKIFAVPNRGVDTFYSKIESIDQLHDLTRNQIEHFFKHYKEAEPDKFAEIHGRDREEYAKKLITETMTA